MLGISIIVLIFSSLPLYEFGRWLARLLRKTGSRALFAAGMAALAALYLPTAWLFSRSPFGMSPVMSVFLRDVGFYLPGMLFAAVVIVLALLLASSLRYYQERKASPQPEWAGRYALGNLALSALLLYKLLQHVYSLTLWGNVYPLIFFTIFKERNLVLPFLAALSCGVMLFVVLRRGVRWSGVAYALLVPALVYAAYLPAAQADTGVLTEQRAGRVAQAVERYYQRRGVYPASLGQLVPWYIPSIPGPLILYGQDWCYDSGPGYYRLGYVNHFTSDTEILISHTSSSQGQPAGLPSLCQAQIDALKARFPQLFGSQ